MSFLYTSLLWGLPLLAAPLVIHLINLRRRRRIEWGAMQFLLESQRRNRKWIVLKQLLLLAMRTAAVALAVFMLAGPVIRSGWANLFGTGVTHHLILLDDSYSMSDQWSKTSALEEAKRVVTQLLDQARLRSEDQALTQFVTIVRFSEARGLAAGAQSVIDRHPLNAQTLASLERFLQGVQPSETDAGPVEALQAAARLVEPAAGETQIAYLISDFRRPQWQDQAELRQLVSRLRERTSKLLLVQSVYDQRPNLAITRLAPESGIRGADVEFWMDVAVANYGDQAANNVSVSLAQDGEQLISDVIDEVAPGEETTQRFRVRFPSAGAHQFEARLENDPVAADNARFFAAQIPAALPVLVIDGSPRGDDGYYLRTALNPVGRQSSGWAPQVEPLSYLRRHEALAEYAAIFLLDVPRFDEPEVAALEDYVRSGGGLAIFVGPETLKSFYNERLYRNGEGMLPAPLDVPTQLMREPGTATADIEATDHPLLAAFAGQDNSALAAVSVNFYYGIDAEWRPPASGDVSIAAQLRNGAPLVMEKRLGAGRVVLALIKVSPQPTELGSWSDLGGEAAMIVMANELAGYLSATRRQGDARLIGEALRLTVDEAGYLPEMKVRSLADAEQDAATVIPEAVDGQYVIQAPGESHSGVWEFQLTTREGKPESRYVAVNVPVGEGDLHLIGREELAELLRGIDYEYALASQFSNADDVFEEARLSDALLYALLAMLVGEQLLAVSASYVSSRPRTFA
jgi:hypothetical protein